MKKNKLNLRLPREEVKVLEDVAEIAEVSVDQVCGVLIAFGILRAQAAGLLPKKKRK